MTGVRRAAAATLAAGMFAAALCGVSGCSGFGSGSTSDARHEDAQASSDVSAPPQVLKIGQTFTSNGASVTLRQIRRPMVSKQPGQSPRDPGDEWIGLNVKTCVSATASEAVDVGWWTFAGLGKGGDRYPGLVWRKKIKPLPSNNWPVPQYPTFGKIVPGQCEAGWLLLAGKKGKPLDSVVFTDAAGAPLAKWRTRKG